MKHIIICLVFLTSALYCCNGLKVERVYLGSETEWVTSSPVYVNCDITEEDGEVVEEVIWTHEGKLVYHWVLNASSINDSSVAVYGVLVDRVDVTKSTWNIKINRIAMELEGLFVCSPVSDYGGTDSGSLQFIINYAVPDMTNITYVNEEECNSYGSGTFQRVYPRPITICHMLYTYQQFKLQLAVSERYYENEDGTYFDEFSTSANFTEYPSGSVMRCYRNLYGEEIELLNWVPIEAKSCPNIEPTPLQPGYTLTDEQTVAGCRSGVKEGSKYVYTCSANANKKVESTCESSGSWSNDLSLDASWPTCSAGRHMPIVYTMFSWTLIASYILYILM